MTKWFLDHCYPVTVVSLAVLFVYVAAREQTEWEKFAREHDCKLVESVAGTYTHGSVGGKSADFYTQGRTTYLCNDGVRYTR